MDGAALLGDIDFGFCFQGLVKPSLYCHFLIDDRLLIFEGACFLEDFVIRLIDRVFSSEDLIIIVSFFHGAEFGYYLIFFVVTCF